MLFWFVLAFSLSLLGVGLLRRILLHLAMVDHPGQRRLHQIPVARGGGLAMIVAAMAAMLIASGVNGRDDLLLFNAGLLLAAGVGWWDDRRSLGIAPRLLVHVLAGLCLCAAFWQIGMMPAGVFLASWWLPAVLVVGVVASINLHNFIDGANGMLSLQTLFVLALLFVLTSGKDPALTLALLCSAGAVLGFLPWNFPQARVFMGDVGSAGLGYLLAGLTCWSWAGGAITLVEALLLHSLVLIDSLCTLGFRFASGRRWWRAHREHLYQWLVRTGRSHAQVVVRVQLWNLLLITPLITWIARRSTAGVELVPFATGLEDPWAACVLVLVFATGITIWWVGKRRLLRAHRAKCRNETIQNAGIGLAGHR
jgi:UDP-N-acetylmuramyl pentapeptide phosphotransferase/UDP-N-acetylglucosamine-1-phosphate transferase